MFMPLSKPNYFIVPTLEVINLLVWESRGRTESTREKGGRRREEEEEDDRVFTVLPRCGMK